MLGLEDENALGRCNIGEFFVEPKERARLVNELIAYGRVRHFEYQMRTRTGRTIIVIENSRLAPSCPFARALIAFAPSYDLGRVA